MNNIKIAREKAGISQKEIAITLGVAQPTVSGWENGRRVLAGDKLVKLAKILNVTVDYLLGNSNDSSPPTRLQTPKEITTEEFLAQHGVTDKKNVKMMEEILEIMVKANQNEEHADEIALGS